MKNVSLLKVTALVVTAAFASTFVNAEDKLDRAVKDINKTVEKIQSQVAEAADQLKFSALTEKLDSDKNGMLSEAEVSANESELLTEEFNKMDANQDKQIDEAEYNSYLAAAKDNATKVIKSVI